MLTPRVRAALVLLAASAGLSACTSLGPYGGIGVGVGNSQYGYDPYYSGYGYGSPYSYTGYGSPYGYAGYGSGYGYDPYGWYNGYYYPGSGYWVYDRDRNRRTLTPEERAYWLERIQRYRAQHGTGTTSTSTTTSIPTGQQVRENWSGFNRRRPASVEGTPAAGTETASTTATGRDAWRQRVLEQRAQRAQAIAERGTQVTADREEARAERQQARQADAQERSEARQQRRRPRD